MYKPSFPRKSRFHQEIARYPQMDPLLIAVDWTSANFIRRLNGVCLLCDETPHSYDLGTCFNKEVWVLYSDLDQINQAFSPTGNIQLAGATKVAILLLTLQDVNDDNNNRISTPYRTTSYQSSGRLGRPHLF